MRAGRARRAVAVLLVLGRVALASCSYGDQQPRFQRCLQQCVTSGCSEPGVCVPSCDPRAGGRPDDLDLVLRIMRWDCTAECKYRCMHATERARAGAAAVKYYGKWPFQRALGMQEPASVALSLANLGAHVVGYKHFRAALPHGLHQLRALWTGYAALSANAWVWSAVFHSRDTAATQALDYFSADTLLAYALFAALVRTRALTHSREWGPLAALLLAGLAVHMYYMAFVLFDYGWNTRVCVLLGVAHSLVWAVWAVATRHPQRRLLLSVLFAAHAASLFELLDFAPVAGVLDAHALWHAATPAVTLAWYRFLAADAASAHKPRVL